MKKRKPIKEFPITELKVNTQLFEILDKNTKDSLRSLIGYENTKDFLASLESHSWTFMNISVKLEAITVHP